MEDLQVTIEPSASQSRRETGIILVNTGTPLAPTPEAVRSYLRDFLTDPCICPMHPLLWKTILSAFILPRRSQASARKYELIWTSEGSPLAVAMRSLVQRVARNFDRLKIVHALSYSTPSVRESLLQLKSTGCNDLLVVPLFPQAAYSTTRAVEGQIQRELGAIAWSPSIEVVHGYSEESLYLDAIADSIREAGFREDDRLLMTFHSIPMKDVSAGDTYGEQVQSTADAIAQRLSLDQSRWKVGFQSRFDKGRKWLGPFTKEALTSFPDDRGRLFIVAPNFAVDCLETLYDIEMELKSALLAQNPLWDESAVRYVPCLNDSDRHARVLTGVIRNRLA